MKVNSRSPVEDETTEYKASLSELDKGIEALAAMLNKHGRGEVFFGASNDGDAIGLKDQVGAETVNKISARIAETLKPSVVPSIALEDYGGDKVIHVVVKGDRKPYSCAGDYRIRVGSSNRKIEPDLLGELFFDSSASSLEAFEAIDQKLTFDKLKYFFVKNGLTVNEEHFCDNAKLRVRGKFNMLAQLLADVNDVSIKVVRFSGKDKSVMVSRNEFGNQCLFSSMIAAVDYVKSLNETRVDVSSGIERKELRLFDTHAFEEAWTNACAHNRWVRNIPPAIYVYDDRLEIVSSGGLPFGLSKKDFYSGVSHPVNGALFSLMGQLNLIEQTGHGNVVIVARYGEEAFEIADSHITVTIPFAFEPSMKRRDLSSLSPAHAKVFLAIKDNPTFSAKELSSHCGLSASRISQITADLKRMGRIERAGSRKSGYWKVK